MDIQSYLLGKKSGGGGGGGSIKIESLDDYENYIKKVTDKFDDFINSKMSLYPTYTSEEITLYTPDNICKNYIIHKKSNGKYRIIWTNYDYASIFTNTSIGFLVFTLPNDVLSGGKPRLIDNIKQIQEIKPGSNTLPSESYSISFSYYSTDFDTINDLINAISSSSGNITYTKYNSGFIYSAIMDSPYLITYSNMPIVDTRSNNFDAILSQRISKNEIIVQK